MRRLSSPDGEVFAVVDIETTGLSPWLHDRVIEVAVVRVDPARGILDEYVTLVNPDRDIGPTHIHGITAGEVAKAPPFNALVGDIAEHIQGAVVVGHNVRFDVGFLAAEFIRAGIDVPPFPAICTLRLAAKLRLGIAGRKLHQCCDEVGIGYGDAHSALDDARCAAHLFGCYLAMARRSGAFSLTDLGCLPLDLPDSWCMVAPSGRAVTRSEVKKGLRVDRSYLASLVEKLPPTPFEDPDEAAYLELLDRALEDRRLTDEEADALFHTAEQWGLSRAKVFEAHHRYLAGLVRTALADGIVTDAERRDLECVCDLLGLHRSALDHTLTEEGRVRTIVIASPGEPPPTRLSGLAGLTVCFTGDLGRMTRDEAEILAMKGGLFVRKNVTKKLDILVAADPDSASGKAKRARDYGIRIMAAPAFFREIGQ